jgi:hypothetical protein
METVPILGDIETLSIVGLLASLMLFFMLRYFSKARQYEDCLESKHKEPEKEPEKLL